MPSLIRRLLKARSGATAIEYALVAGCIALVIVTAVGAVGTQLNTLFQSVANAFPQG